MSVAMTLAFRTDVNAPLVTHMPVTLMMQGDDRANVIELTMVDGDTPLNLDGYSAVLYLGRKDGVKVRCPGTVAGNVAKVTLQAECYSVPGPYAATMKLTGPEEKRTVLRLAGYVESDGEGPIIDPSGTIPSYDDLERIMKELEDALQQAENATSGANAAAQNANAAAGSANTAAGAANTAAGNATTATSRANTAAASIEGLTVEASDVAYNQPATATVTDVGGHKHIAFGLRQGVPGPVPTLTFTGETGEPNTDVVITQSGPPEAPVVNLKIPQGVPGTGNVSSVDGVVSDTGGNVNLSAVRYVAQTLEDAQKVQVRKNIGIDGQVYTCTAQALESMTQEQQAELYVQGYRAVQATNNETVVTLGLAADGALSWQGCNEDTANLLDNPNFAIAQAGYGGMHGTVMYAADRWGKTDGSATFSSAQGGGLTITMTQPGHIYQKTPTVEPGKVYTIAASINGMVYTASEAWPENGTGLSEDFPGGTIYAQTGFGCVVYFSSTLNIQWVRLLSGSYTPKTLPPWEAPDSVSEITKCRQFYRPLSAYGFVGIAVADTTNSVQGVIFGDSMRIYNPSMLGTFVVFTPTASTNISSFQSVSYQGNGFRFIAQTTGGISVGTVGFLVPSPENGAISADL